MITPSEPAIDDLIAALTLDEKTSLTAGEGLWYLPSVERVGIPGLKVSDGPSGVRGDSLIGRRSLSLPCGMAIGSTWNEELVGRLGVALAGEAKSKGVHVLLGPTVCIVRQPLAGRTFESYSEDPLLTGRLAVSYVRGVQGHGVACCIKHFACNDQEYARMTISAEVDARTLREVHLPAFAAAVQEAGVWSVMTAYNRVNGVYCGEQADLIGGVLRGDWGFDGLVMSDWFGTHSTVPAALAGLDLEMPGPSAWFGPSLAAAVRSGEVDEVVVDGQVRHLLRLMSRVGILEGGAPRVPELEEDDPARRAVARQVATEGTVLLVNNGLLPLDQAVVQSIAVIGPNAGLLEVGGGSSEVTPHRRRRLADALHERLPGVEVGYEVGCRIHQALPNLDVRLLTNESLSLSYYDNLELTGEPVGGDVGHSARLLWVAHLSQLPEPVWPVGTSSVRITAELTPDVSGLWKLGLESAGGATWRLDGEVVLNNSEPTRGAGFYGAGSALIETEIELEAGRPYAIEVDLWYKGSPVPVMGVRLAADRPEEADEFEQAVVLAASSDVVVVVVGSNGSWESEGFDRPDLSLPGRQRELVEAIIAANPRTVVIVNAGSPVEMPWAESAGAVLLPWYSGEEGADAIADVLVGLSEPSGRLPVSLPKRIEDTSAFGHYPGADGQVTYGEGIFVGYRNPTVAATTHFPFGHGLSYTTFDYSPVEVESPPGSEAAITVRFDVTNSGARPGCEVAQVYVHALDVPSSNQFPRPDRVLAGFTKVTLDPGAIESVTLELDAHAFAHWAEDWVTDPGQYELLIGSSSQEVRQRVEVSIT